MLPIQRQELILKLLNEKDAVSIIELHQKLQVTEMTIRRDLVLLEEQGSLERIRGGAVKTRKVNGEFLFDKKNNLMKTEKEAIGRIAPGFLENGETVFINSGSTVLQVLQSASKLPDFNIKIVTNNPLVSMNDISLKSELVFLGGEMRRETYSIVGDFALQMLSQIYATKAIIGMDGICIKHGLTTSNYAEACINQKMIKQTTGQVIIVADHTKIGRVAPFQSAQINDIDTILTTSGFPEEYREQFEDKGIRVIIAD